MGKAKRVIRCQCCGEILQDSKKNEPGYISKAVMELNPKIPYCNKCYKKMLELNSSELKEDLQKDISKILDDAIATDALVIWVVDTFSFNGNINHEIAKKLKRVNVLIIGTKFDLYDGICSKDDMKNFIGNSFKDAGLKAVSVFLMNHNIDYDYLSLRNELDNIRQGHDVYMIGNFMSGKTTLINRFLKSYVNNSKRSISTIEYPNTYAQVLEIPLTNSSFFYELPDLPIDTSILSHVEKDIHKQIVPKKKIEVINKALVEGETFVLGNLGFYSLISGEKTNFKIYSGEAVEIKKLKTIKLKEFMQDNFNKKHTRPVSENISSFLDYDVFDYEMEDDDKLHDIGIEGLGWISFIAKGQTIRVYCPKGTALKELYSKVGK